MSAAPALAPDAAMVLGIAATAMPFALTTEAEAERWLRLLRLHGEVGAVLQALGIGEQPLRAPDESGVPERAAPAGEGDRDVVTQVTEHAGRIAEGRGAEGIATTDVLMAVMQVYGEDFDRLLGAYGTDRNEVLQALGARAQRQGED
jgi:hypothetical protein